MNLEMDLSVTFESFIDEISKSNESFGLYKVPYDKIAKYSFDIPISFVKNFLRYGVHTNVPLDFDPYSVANLPLPKTQEWRDNIETYCKYVWLTEGYLQTNGFKYPMGIHWNPADELFYIHPGNTRKMVNQLFCAEKVFIGSNTQGVEVEWVKKFTTLEQLKSHYNLQDIQVAFCRDCGTIVPHVHFENQRLHSYVNEMQNRLTKFYAETKLEANFDLGIVSYSPDVVTNHRKTMTIKLADVTSLELMFKAMALVPIVDSFKDNGVIIETTRS